MRSLEEKLVPMRKSSERNRRETLKNSHFVAFLHASLDSKINFKFGTFVLSLIKAHLEKKPLLVYVHSDGPHEADSVKSILNSDSVAKAINGDFIAYGCYDSHDDYEMLQKYVPISELPSFSLYELDGRTKPEQFLGKISLNRPQQVEHVLGWLGRFAAKEKHVKKAEPARATAPAEAAQPAPPGFSSLEEERNIMRDVQQTYEAM